MSAVPDRTTSPAVLATPSRTSTPTFAVTPSSTGSPAVPATPSLTSSEPGSAMSSGYFSMEASSESSVSGKRKRCGGVSLLPLAAVSELEQWYQDNVTHPYLTTEQNQELSKRLGLTSQQIRKWLANRRTRSGNVRPYNSSRRRAAKQARRESREESPAVPPTCHTPQLAAPVCQRPLTSPYPTAAYTAPLPRQVLPQPSAATSLPPMLSASLRWLAQHSQPRHRASAVPAPQPSPVWKPTAATAYSAAPWKPTSAPAYSPALQHWYGGYHSGPTALWMTLTWDVLVMDYIRAECGLHSIIMCWFINCAMSLDIFMNWLCSLWQDMSLSEDYNCDILVRLYVWIFHTKLSN